MKIKYQEDPDVEEILVWIGDMDKPIRVSLKDISICQGDEDAQDRSPQRIYH